MPRSAAFKVSAVFRPGTVLLLATIALLALPTAAHAQISTPSGSGPSISPAPAVEDQVVLSGAVTVPKGSSVGEIVVFHGRVQIAGSVQGDVVILDGPVTISGAYITGSVVALNGPIHITGATQIGGDVLSAERVTADPGVKVGGQVREDVGFTLQGELTVLGALVGEVAVAVSVLLWGLVLLLMAPRGADRVARAATTAPFASLGWGVLLAIAVPLACVAAMASVVGLPLGLAALLALGLLFFTGLAWTAWTIGRSMVHGHGRALPFLAGWGAVALVGLVPFVNAAVWILGSLFGLGAMTVAAWRARGHHRGRHRAGKASRDRAVFVREATVQVLADQGSSPAYPATSDD
jgi:cytoskeletal protein CcmA (bactofilin family)